VVVIEVKRGHTAGSIGSDVRKLRELSKNGLTPVRRFIVLVCEGNIPEFAFSKSRSRRGRGAVDLGFDDVSVLVRRLFKAVGSLAKSKQRNPKHISQHWVVLLEVQ
jgi:hypothetical protein